MVTSRVLTSQLGRQQGNEDIEESTQHPTTSSCKVTLQSGNQQSKQRPRQSITVGRALASTEATPPHQRFARPSFASSRLQSKSSRGREDAINPALQDHGCLLQRTQGMHLSTALPAGLLGSDASRHHRGTSERGRFSESPLREAASPSHL
jgi:hypothetical protein